MFNRLFGQYLWEKGVLSKEQLQEALLLEQSTRIKIGVLALNSSYLTAPQIEEIHQLQTTQDKRFGEIALEKSYLTAEQLEILLGQQKKSHLLLSQAILDKGYLTLEELGKYLAQYKKQANLTEEDIATNDPGKIIRKLVKLSAENNQELYYDYYTLLVKNIIRFLDCQPTVQLQNSQLINPWYIEQKIIGSWEARTVLAVEQEALIKIAAQFSGEPINSADELAQASVAEFLNQHNGIFLVNMSNKGLELNLQPQYISQKRPENLAEANCLNLNSPLGKVELWLK